MPDPSVATFQQLYEAAFGPLRVRAAARHVLYEHEFRAEMADPRIDKIVAWADDGEPVGLTTFTNQLESVPWISPEFFRSRYPEQAARNAIFYLGFVLVHPHAMHSGAFRDMVAEAYRRTIAARGVCGWDICGFNDGQFQLGRASEKIITAWGNTLVETVDHQTFYAAHLAEHGNPAHNGSASTE
ncbi:hypothetical protein [Skermania piniformis]|uniref:N-acetyltransferase domain-containing protein n=1 Tax=Skermania pinensis TaxID=39122 RepID=A0ABX8SAU4_9ACTN|nr:hypothetical protein [Skermania piniformis]QXQ12841.1 hypothetical protein KV203_13010 [Skermania piniformis]